MILAFYRVVIEICVGLSIKEMIKILVYKYDNIVCRAEHLKCRYFLFKVH